MTTRLLAPLSLAMTLAMMLAITPLAVPLAPAQAQPRSERVHVRLDGVDTELRAHTRQVVTVRHTRGHHARVTLWRERKGEWQRVLRATDGRIGYGGLVAGQRRRQGTGTTPLGTYDLTSAFGTHPRRDAGELRYRKIRRGDFWVQDNRSRFYNRYRNQRQGGFRWWLPSSDVNSSERLTDYPRQYEWSIVTSYNKRQVRHRGSGIFLHVNGSGATAGCASAPLWFIAALIRRLDPDLKPRIAIGR